MASARKKRSDSPDEETGTCGVSDGDVGSRAACAAGKSRLESFGSGFASHLKRIREAKLRADEMSRNAVLDTQQASMALLWEMVFDILCNCGEISLADFNALAGVVQKLSSAKPRSTQTVDAGASGERASPKGLSEEALARIEEQLKML